MREIYAWLLGAVALVLIGATSAPAQTVLPPYAPIVCAYNSSLPTLTSGQMGWVQCDLHGQLITSGGGGGASATGFNFAVTGTPFSATTGGVTSASFTSSTEVVVSNVGTTNGAYCSPGATATISSQYIAPGSWFAFYASGGITQISCITSASTTTINISAGSGLPTGSGGGSGGGGGGGGTVTQGTAASSGPWIFTPWIAGVVNSATNGLFTDILQGNAVLGATNGLYSNVLQGNVALSATNGLYTNLLQGNAVLSATNPIFVSPATSATWAATESGTWNITNISGTVSLPTGAATSANQGLSPSITNPTSTLTTPASTTTAYSAGQLISNNATAGSIVVPSFVIANSGGGAVIAGLTLGIADTTSTAWPSALIQIDLWRAAPTFTNGDRGVYLVSTGTANYVGSYSCLMGPASGDGYYGACTPMGPALLPVALASTATVFWTMKAVTTGGTVGAAKVFTVTAQALN